MKKELMQQRVNNDIINNIIYLSFTEQLSKISNKKCCMYEMRSEKKSWPSRTKLHDIASKNRRT